MRKKGAPYIQPKTVFNRLRSTVSTTYLTEQVNFWSKAILVTINYFIKISVLVVVLNPF
jgi:hypothetical protein